MLSGGKLDGNLADSVHVFRSSILHHYGRVHVVPESCGWVMSPVDQNRTYSTAHKRGPASFRHFLPRPCTVDKETRTVRSLSFSAGREDGGHSGRFSELGPKEWALPRLPSSFREYRALRRLEFIPGVSYRVGSNRNDRFNVDYCFLNPANSHVNGMSSILGVKLFLGGYMFGL